MIFSRDPLADSEQLIKRVYAYVAYRIGEGPDAEDVTSETFERAVRYRHSYDPAKGEPIAWLIGIARRCLEGRPRPLIAQQPEAGQAASADDLEAETLARLGLQDAIARLEDEDRELIALRYGADLSARRIGNIVGKQPNAVDVALHRARARLRAELEAPAVRKERSEPVDEVGENFRLGREETT